MRGVLLEGEGLNKQGGGCLDREIVGPNSRGRPLGR